MAIVQASRPRSVWPWLAMVLALGMPMPVDTRAQSPELNRDLSHKEQQLLEEYRNNYERLRQAYTSNIRIEVVRRRSDFLDNPEGSAASRLSYSAGDGKRFRMDAARLVPSAESPVGATSVQLATPEGYVIAKRESPGEPFVILDWSDDPEEGLALLSSEKFQWSPYSCYELPLEWFIFHQPGFMSTWSIGSITEHEEAGERLVSVSVGGITKLRAKNWRGSFIFLRDRAWAIKEYSWGDADPMAPEVVRNARYDYEGDHEGVPLLKRVEYWEERGPDRKRLANEVFEVQRIQVGPVPEEEFTLESIGLSLGKQRSRWAWRLAAVLATVLVFALLYVVLRRREAIQAQKGAAN